jgi:DNA polymerase I-like protein with 3'-5' exonuclease and polymerase domains
VQLKFDLPEPAIKYRAHPEGWKPFDDFPELHGVVALDLETRDPGLQQKRGSSWAIPGEGHPCGFSIAFSDADPYTGMPASATKAFYCGTQHSGGNCDVDKAVRWLKAQAAKPDVTFVYANCIYDLGWMLTHWGIEPVNHPIDVQGMAALIDEQRSSYSLDSLMHSYLDRRKTGDDLAKRAWDIGIPNAMSNMHRLPAWVVEPYAIDDAVGTLDLYHKLLPEISAQKLDAVWALERECYLVAVDLKRRGVRVSPEQVEKTKRSFREAREVSIQVVKDLTGVLVSPNDFGSLAAALKAENPDLQMETTSTGRVSIRAGVIDAMGTPVSRAIRTMRQMDKAIGTFIEGYLEAYTSSDNRIHAEFHPLRRTADAAEGGGNNGTVTGRWSSSGPNLQNIPRRDPVIGPAMRRCFLPEEGELWAKLDYSSQEPRLATHFAYVARAYQDHRGRWQLPTKASDPREMLPGAADMVARYNSDPELSFHKFVGREMGVYGVSDSAMSYDSLKIVNLALIYGMSGKTFCETVGLPTMWHEKSWGDRQPYLGAGPEGQRLLDLHAKAVPWGKPLARIFRQAAEIRGYTRTILGRRIRFTRRYAEGNLMGVEKALNASIQGSAADQMKSAQVLFRREGIPITVVVHDDGNLSIPQGEAGERLLRRAGDIMAEALKLSVPSIAESKVGLTWGDV